MSRLVALLACHNRKDRTLACLRSLFDQDQTAHDIEAIVVDDGSNDGTAGAVEALFPSVEVIRGDGALYWARSMALAEERALARAPDYLLWLNDDVVLDRRALRTLFAAETQPGGTQIVVGSVVDPETGIPTYGGVDRVDWHPMRYRLVAPDNAAPQPCTTFNGNVVLVPRRIYREVGGIERRFTHALADFDYGLRAGALGFQVVVTGTAVGTCVRGLRAPWDEPSLSLVSRYRLMLGRKGVPVRSFALYLRRYGGRAWPLYLLATYAKVATNHVRVRMLSARAYRG
jgi:GT2 family glycosyltransferase